MTLAYVLALAAATGASAQLFGVNNFLPNNNNNFLPSNVNAFPPMTNNLYNSFGAFPSANAPTFGALPIANPNWTPNANANVFAPVNQLSSPFPPYMGAAPYYVPYAVPTPLPTGVAAPPTTVTSPPAVAPGPKVSKVSYHLGDSATAKTALSNIQNHINGYKQLGVTGKFVAIINASALRSFVKDDRFKVGFAGIDTQIQNLMNQGVEFKVCQNTMDAFNLTPADIWPVNGFLPEGGVTRLSLLQDDGYSYIKP